MEGMGSAVQLVTPQLSFASVVTLLRGAAVSTELTSWSKTNQEGKTGSSHPHTTQKHRAGIEPEVPAPPDHPVFPFLSKSLWISCESKQMHHTGPGGSLNGQT